MADLASLAPAIEGVRRELVYNLNGALVAVLYCGSNRDVLPHLGRFGALVTDPPYGLGAASASFQSGASSLIKSKKQYAAKDWDKMPDPEGVELARKCADLQIIFGGNYYALPPSAGWLIWDKLTNGNYADVELAWTNLPMAARQLKCLWNGFARVEKARERVHPTQKPEQLMVWAIEFCKGAQTILDPYMGSGTTGAAALRTGRLFCGVEQEADYFEYALNRLRAVASEPVFDLAAVDAAPEPADTGSLFEC